jgi:cytochrome c biogenesis protein CcmG/thiol:disulfide interchange protein DsbE
MRALRFIACGCALLAATTVVRAQISTSKPPASKSASDSGAKHDADAEKELQKALDSAGNDRAALVRNLKDYLRRFPEAPRRAAVDRALVEACQQLRDDDCALDYSEQLIAEHPDDSEMMLLAASILQRKRDDASLIRASGYVTRVLDRVQKSTPNERPERVSLKEWQDHRDSILSQLYALRGQIGKSQHTYDAAIKDLQMSYALRPNAVASEALGEIAEIQKDLGRAIQEYSLAFVLPEAGPAGKVDRSEIRLKLGNVWKQTHGSEQGLGEQILTTYDYLRPGSPSDSPAARNSGAQDLYSFVLRRVDNTPLFIAPYRGKTIVMSFWATWCTPCHLLEPLFDQVAKSYSGDPNIFFFSISTDDDQSLVGPFVAREKWTVPVAFADGLDDFLKVGTLPTVIIIDRKGKIVYRVGGFTPDTFSEELTTAIQTAVTLPAR